MTLLDQGRLEYVETWENGHQPRVSFSIQFGLWSKPNEKQQRKAPSVETSGHVGRAQCPLRVICRHVVRSAPNVRFWR